MQQKAFWEDFCCRCFTTFYASNVLSNFSRVFLLYHPFKPSVHHWNLESGQIPQVSSWLSRTPVTSLLPHSVLTAPVPCWSLAPWIRRYQTVGAPGEIYVASMVSDFGSWFDDWCLMCFGHELWLMCMFTLTVEWRFHALPISLNLTFAPLPLLQRWPALETVGTKSWRVHSDDTVDGRNPAPGMYKTL